MTGVTVDGSRERCLIAGMDDYLAKPIRRGQLDVAIARWLV
jgi:CheY-like chemotaxis protein